MKQAFKLAFPLVALSIGATSAQAECIDRGFSDIEDSVLNAYIAYYGRPADPAGLAWWAEQLEAAGGDLSAIINQFGNSREFVERYGSLSSTELVNNIYRQLFNRDADEAGLAWYVGLLDSGEKTLQTITLDIMGGATGEDRPIVENRKQVAKHFVSQLEAADISLSDSIYNTLMQSVEGSASTAQAACSLVNTSIIASGGVIDPGDNDGGNNDGDARPGIINQGNGNCVTFRFPAVGNTITLKQTNHLSPDDETTLTMRVTESTGTTFASHLDTTAFVDGTINKSTSTQRTIMEISNGAYYLKRDESESSSTVPGFTVSSTDVITYSPYKYLLPVTICEGMSWNSGSVTANSTSTTTFNGMTTNINDSYKTDNIIVTVESLNEKVTVPAGTFSTIKMKYVDTYDNSVSYAWSLNAGWWIKMETFNEDGNLDFSDQAIEVLQ